MRNYKRIWRLLNAPIVITCEELPSRAKHPHSGLGLKIIYCGATFTGKQIMFQLPDDKTAIITVDHSKTLDAKGLPASVDSMSFVSSDPSIASVDAAGIVTPVGVGSASINVTAMIGTESKSDIIEIEVVAGAAVSFGATIALN